MTVLRLVLADQLSRNSAVLKDADPDRDTILMAEVMEEATYVPHHPKKIAFLFSAMRHFAEDLRSEGFTVRYWHLDDAGNTGSLDGIVAETVKSTRAERLVCLFPGEYRVHQKMRAWQKEMDTDVEIRDDDRFLARLEFFDAWASGRKNLRMEYFYREMRKSTGILMDKEGSPLGGQWNFDRDNRKPLPEDLKPPAIPEFTPDAITREVLDLVADRFASHYGRLEPFGFPVTRIQALECLDDFIANRLKLFGDYQDAMKAGEPFMFHSLLGFLMNSGLLDPREVIGRAVQAYEQEDAPLNAVEGFIRQILGWREFIRGLYWRYMPDYYEWNALEAKRDLPGFYWTAETDMNCMRESIQGTLENAYAHHIQRLMVTGNFALLAGIDPKQVNEWYLVVYADAYEWVELPNVSGMILYADNGLMASKPYAAGGAYINRMSDYCRGCAYDVRQKTGEKACPFNYLYWNFLIKNEENLRGNPRMGLIYKNLDRKSEEERSAIQQEAANFLASL